MVFFLSHLLPLLISFFIYATASAKVLLSTFQVQPMFTLLFRKYARKIVVRSSDELISSDNLDRMWESTSELLVFGGLLVLLLLTFVKYTYLFAYLFGFFNGRLAAMAIVAARVLHENSPI